MEEIIDEIPAGVNTLQLKNEEEKEEEINEGDENSLLVIKELKNLDQNKVQYKQLLFCGLQFIFMNH